MVQSEIEAFWERYETADVATAMQWLESATGGYKSLEDDVADLVRIARERGIDLVKFLTELDEFLTSSVEDDTTSDNESETDPVSESES